MRIIISFRLKIFKPQQYERYGIISLFDKNKKNQGERTTDYDKLYKIKKVAASATFNPFAVLVIILNIVVKFLFLIDKINIALYEIINDIDLFIDLKRLICLNGIKKCYSDRYKYRWMMPYSKDLLECMASEIYKQYSIKMGKSKKCLVLDCDNVLWGGVLSEDGMERVYVGNSGVGRKYSDFQKFVLFMYLHGCIIALCSKNDESDIRTMLLEHNAMVLKDANISYYSCNWNNKVGNIKAIAEDLNIGLDSIVFVDDSVFEIEAIQAYLSEVKCILFEIQQLDKIYEELECFNLKHSCRLEDIALRTNTYKSDFERRKILKKVKMCYLFRNNTGSYFFTFNSSN